MEDIKEKILVVDDEVLIRKLLCQKLTKEGYDCEEADSVSSALQKIETGLIDLVITDIRMSGEIRN
jgi:CheY-like chemotaxis protein